MTPDPKKKTSTLVVTTALATPEQVTEELKRRAEAVKEQLQRLEEAKIVKQETMQIEASI